jgi:hypothetical protein
VRESGVTGGAQLPQVLGDPAGVDPIGVEVATAHAPGRGRVRVGVVVTLDRGVPLVADETVRSVVTVRPVLVERVAEGDERRRRIPGGHGGVLSFVRGVRRTA